MFPKSTGAREYYYLDKVGRDGILLTSAVALLGILGRCDKNTQKKEEYMQ